MTKRLATAVAASVTVLGAMGLMAPAAMAATMPATVTPAMTCGPHQEVTGTTRNSYYGNCADHAVNIDVVLVVIPPGSDLPTVIDKGNRCVPAQTDYFLGTTSTIDNLGGYGASEQGTC